MKDRVKLIARKRGGLRYQTRMMAAGDPFEATPRDARLFKALGYAEDAPVEETKPRARVTRDMAADEAPAPTEAPEAPAATVEEPVAAPDEPPAESDEDDSRLEDMTRDELIALAEERGVELPSGYVRKDQLVALLSGDEGEDR